VGRLANTTHQLVRVLRDERDEVDDLLRDCDANIAAARGLYASLPASTPAALPEPVVVAAPVAAAADGVDMDWQAIEASVQARGALGDCPICMMGMSGIAAERRGVELLSCSHCFQSASHWLRLPSGCAWRWPERSGRVGLLLLLRWSTHSPTRMLHPWHRAPRIHTRALMQALAGRRLGEASTDSL